VKTRSLAIQEKIINLAKDKIDLNILFTHNMISFCFDGYMLNKPKTNIEKNLELAAEDKK
jgi:hypothetical protein